MIQTHTVKVFYAATAVTVVVDDCKTPEEALKKAEWKRRGTARYAKPLRWEVRTMEGALVHVHVPREPLKGVASW